MTRLDEPTNGAEAAANIVTKWSDSIAKFSAAFVKAQLEIEGAAKDKNNPHFKSRYADLASVMDACKESLNKQGIAIIQTPADAQPGWLGLTTMLLHESGEWMAGTGKLPVAGNGPQAYGSAITYARRFFLAAMVGVAPVDGDPIGGDDDGEQAQGRGQQQQQPRRQQNGTTPPAITFATSEQVTLFQTLAKELGIDIPATLETLKVKALNDVTATNMDRLIARAEDRKRERDVAEANQGTADDGEPQGGAAERDENKPITADEVKDYQSFADLYTFYAPEEWSEEQRKDVVTKYAAQFKTARGPSKPETLGSTHRARFLNYLRAGSIDAETGRVKQTVPAA